MRRLAAVAVAAVAALTVSVAFAASSPSLTVYDDDGDVIAVFPEIPGTPCWNAPPYVVAPEGVSFTECTPTTTTTTAPSTTTTVATTTSTTVAPTTTTTVATTTSTTVATTSTTTTTSTSTSTTTVPPTTTTTLLPGGVQFVETFDTAASLDRFDFGVHHAWTANSTDNAWPGDHDNACGAANTVRVVNNPTAVNDGRTWYPGLIQPTSYWCREHLMTSFNTNHYAQVDFAPKATFTDVDRVCFDQSRNLLGSRHWTQLVVVPLDTFEANNGRLDYVASRFSPTGPGKYGIHPTDETLLVEFGKGVPRVQVGQTVYSSNGLAWNAGNDRATRYEHCIIDTGSGLRIEIDRAGGTEVFTRGGGIPDGPVKVIFQQDLYNPDKANDATGAYTVHWDAIVIE